MSELKCEMFPEPHHVQEIHPQMKLDSVYRSSAHGIADMTPPEETNAGTKRSLEDTVEADNYHADRKLRTRSPAHDHHEATSFKRTRQLSSSRPPTQPRWHNQSYMLFLALRQHPDRCLPRTDLIKAALALDRKISEERNLPKVFRGKTPMNSASAILTNNSDRYFIPFKPSGSRSMHFRLAYEPGNFANAVEEYRKWEKKLIEQDWPHHFGVPKPAEGPDTVHTNDEQQNIMTEFDEFIASRQRARRSGCYEDKENTNKDRRRSSRAEKKERTEQPLPNLDQLDLTRVPTSWKDIVRVDENLNLYATRRLPPDTPLGFYFGVPMTEDEFDSLKQGVGSATRYSVMYRKTILDATSENGEPFDDPKGGIYCPFHFMSPTEEADANVSLVEGSLVNQVICTTKKTVEEGEELLVWHPTVQLSP
ncbi:hypothetical protein DFQ28_006082 [Apophysomyces sp. BC1034]|nr:hypothetical protein DFQ30_006056 [Apophysomyces sp. BC1015]KAG0169572.1 hypothetical protein DFQ29_009640 [Apophysomyces sp. BC1021]KAG0187596.1 hypothetical protein DFQ28_006082 [Apophysomyces sp. BC1034]